MKSYSESLTRTRFKQWLDGEIQLCGGQADLFNDTRLKPRSVLSAELIQQAYRISCFRSSTPWEFLDAVVARIGREGIRFFENPADRDTIEWNSRLKALRRDIHKAHAFVRFKSVGREGAFAAWHRPDHDTLDLFIGLFCRRFPNIAWTILTPYESVHHCDGKLQFGEGFHGQPPEVNDDWEDFWRTYYSSIYNPARLMVGAMKKEMPVKHWQTLPESRLIPDLIRTSTARVQQMGRHSQSSALSFIPKVVESLDTVSAALPLCRGCGLWQRCRATPGHGKATASLVLVGEQPGDEEEKAGLPFVGPAGQLLRQATLEAGMNWEDLFVTNAVKHFKYEERGESRIHKRADREEIAACRPWFKKEMDLVKPKTVVCLGSTAALCVTGRLWPVETYRGTTLPSPHPFQVFLSYHPAAILRTATDKKNQYYRDLVADLRAASQI